MDRSHKTRLICPLTSPTVEAMHKDMLDAVEAGADAVEFRLDFLETIPTADELEELLANTPIDVIVTFRPVRQGGNYSGDESARLEILRNCTKSERIIVDIEHDVPRDRWPDATIILSFHDFAGLPKDIEDIAQRLEGSDATVNKIVFAATSPTEAFRAFDVIRSCKKPTIALAMGNAGLITRVLARKFGAFGTFASLAIGKESAPGQSTIGQIRNVYRWDSIGPETAVYGIVGCPVSHSMGPAVHNAAFAAIGEKAVYLPLLIEGGKEHFRWFMDGLLARPYLHCRGLSVTIPHKENALNYLGKKNCDKLAVKIGAINTITISPDGALKGDNTDYAGAIDALCTAMGIARKDLAGRSVGVMGAGGVSRAIVAALTNYRAEVTIYNRTARRGEQLAEEFSCQAKGLPAAEKTDAEIIINCTSVGMHPNVDVSALRRIPSSVRVVFDTIYNPSETLLLRKARKAGCLCASGLEMFINQAAEQFEIWTGQDAPREVMRRVVIDCLAAT